MDSSALRLLKARMVSSRKGVARTSPTASSAGAVGVSKVVVVRTKAKAEVSPARLRYVPADASDHITGEGWREQV